MIALGGLLLALPVAGTVVRRRLAARRLRDRALARRVDMQWQAGTRRKEFERHRGGWEPDLAAAVADRLADLDRDGDRLAALPLDSPGLAEGCAALADDYERLGALTEALAEWRSAAERPRSDIGDLLGFSAEEAPPASHGPAGRSPRKSAGDPRPKARGRPAPPDPEVLAGLAARLRTLDERDAELTRRVADAPRADVTNLTDEARSLAGAHRRLASDALPYWQAAFPGRAAARAERETPDVDHYLADARRRAATPRPRPTARPARPSEHSPDWDL